MIFSETYVFSAGIIGALASDDDDGDKKPAIKFVVMPVLHR